MNRNALVRLSSAILLALCALCAALFVLEQPAADAQQPLAQGVTRTYPGASPCNTTLQACISGSADGDSIVIAAGTYLTASLNVTRAVSLVGGGSNPAAVKLHPIGGSGRLIQYSSVPLTASFVISNLTVENGDSGGSSGGGIRVASGAAPLFYNIVVSNNIGTGGGGIRIIPAVPATLISVTVFGNTSAADGGGILASGSLTLIDSSIEGNSSGGNGGAIQLQGGGLPSTISGTHFISNTAVNGGALSVLLSTLAITNSTFLRNTASVDGGAIHALTSTLSFVGTHFNGILFNNNHAANGGAMLLSGPGAVVLKAGGPFNCSCVQFNANSATGEGGALGLVNGAGPATLAALQFTGNSASAGGALAIGSGSALTLTVGSFNANMATATVGGAILNNGALHLATTGDINADAFDFFILNKAQTGGGAIENGAGASLSASDVPDFGLIEFNSNSVVSGDGGAIRNAGEFTLNGGLIHFNSAANGGGLFSSAGAIVTGAVIFSNTASALGGGAFVSGTLLLTNTTFSQNRAATGGGGAFALGPTTVVGGSFERNVVSATVGLGGGILVSNTLSVSGTQFLSNSAASGGGVYVSATLALSNAQFSSNAATSNRGGGVYAVNTATVAGGQFENNIAQGFGGGLYVGSDLSLTNVQVLSNTATTFNGGGADVDGSVTLSGGRFQNNRAHFSGGGLNVSSGLSLTVTQFINNRTAVFSGGGVNVAGAATLSGGRFENNVAGTSGSGGGVLASAALTLTAMDFISNTANGSTVGFNGGGGVAADGSLLISNTRFISNSAPIGGGGLNAPPFSTGDRSIVNSLFAHNQSLNGAALRLDGPGSTFLLHTTIADTSLNPGQALAVFSGTLGITDTIIVSHSIGISRTAGAVFEDYNLFFGTPLTATAGVTSGPHHVLANPLFVNPAAGDYHLGTGSPAIDSGTDAGLRSDFDGDRRPIGNGFDIGFDEVPLRLYLPLIMR